jgi:hypothetical protein
MARMPPPKINPNQVAWKAQPGPQLKAVQMANVPEMLYGGARGGGKTSWLLGDFAQDVPTAAGPSWHGVIFRRTYGQLEEVVRQSLEMYPRWFDPDQKGLVRWMAGEKMWRWANGATLKLRYLEAADDWVQYHGHQYTWIGWDELTTWPTPELYMRMKATLRSSDPNVKFKRIRSTANPGGVGHNWVKEYFRIGSFPEGSELLYPNDGSGMTRIFVKSKLTDNAILMAADPQYIDRLQGLGSPELIKAWVDGDWNVVQGAYFPEFRAATHVVAPFAIPHTWTKLRCMDWGSSAPFAVYWLAVSDGKPTETGRAFPKGALVCYREWYGGQLNNSGKYIGLKLTAEEVAEGIQDRQAQGEELNDSIIDPAAWAQNGGPSIAERMSRATDGACTFRRGDNKRLPGWDMLRERLKGTPEGGPMIYFFDSCPNIIRTLPALQHDENKQEDVDTDGEDHGPDAIRYGCMARPWVNMPPTLIEVRQKGYTLDELWEAHDLDLRRKR